MITLGIIALTVGLSLFCFSNEEGFNRLSFVPYKMNNDRSQLYRFISHAFIHADLSHLAFNMLALYFFGKEVEEGLLSPLEFTLFYLAAIVVSCLPSFQKNKDNSRYVAVGASGAVSAVMFVVVLYAPWSVVYLQFVIPIYFVLFAVGYLLYSSYQSRHGKDNVAHDVHLWGALFAVSYMMIVHPESLRLFIDKIMDAPFI